MGCGRFTASQPQKAQAGPKYQADGVLLDEYIRHARQKQGQHARHDDVIKAGTPMPDTGMPEAFQRGPDP